MLSEQIAREILARNYDGSRENALEAWDHPTQVDQEPYLEDAEAYLALVRESVEKMENPYPEGQNVKSATGIQVFVREDLYLAFEQARQAILKELV